jgi:hypothetical protein
MNANKSRNGDEAEDLNCDVWSAVTLNHMQLVFHEWMSRLERVCEGDGEYAPEQTAWDLHISGTYPGMVGPWAFWRSGICVPSRLLAVVIGGHSVNHQRGAPAI